MEINAEVLYTLLKEERYNEFYTIVNASIDDGVSDGGGSLAVIFFNLQAKIDIEDFRLDKEIMAELLVKIFNKHILPRLIKMQISFSFITYIPLVRLYDVKVPDNPQIKQILRNLKDLQAKADNNKMKYNLYLGQLVVQVFKGEKSALTDFTKKLFNLDQRGMMSSQQEINTQLNALKMIYKNLGELLDIAGTNIFKNSILGKEDDVVKSNFFWLISVAWNAFGYQSEFKKLYDPWIQIFNKLLKKKRHELIFFIHYPITHVYLNLTQKPEEWKILNDELEKPFSEYVEDVIVPEFGLELVNFVEPQKKYKLGFILDRVVANSPFKITLALIRQILKESDDIEVYLYDMEYVEKSPSDRGCVAELLRLGVKYVSNHSLIKDKDESLYYGHFDKCMVLRNLIVKDKINALIGLNSREQLNFIFTARSAPVQIYWSHGNFEYNIPNIDYRITHLYGATSEYDHKYFYAAQDDMMDSDFLAQDNKENILKAAEIREKLPKDKIYLGNIGRYIKLESEDFIRVLADILKRNSNAVFLACGVGGKDYINDLVKKYDIEEQFIFVGFVETKVYAHVLDIFLNTFPLLQGESVKEVVMTGVPILTRQVPDFHPNNKDNELSADILKNCNYKIEDAPKEFLDDIDKLNGLVCCYHTTDEGYVAAADFLLKNDAAYQELREFRKNSVRKQVLDRISSTENSFANLIKDIRDKSNDKRPDNAS